MKISNYQYILCSSFAKVRDILVQQEILNPGTAKVGFIANAADLDLDEHGKAWRNERDKTALEYLGYEIFQIDLKQENSDSLKEKLSQLDVIFVGGGNVFYLLYQMKKSGFSEIIFEFLEKGGLYLSTSAGSCVAAPDIEYVKYADDFSVVELDNYKGLNFCNIGIDPHFDRLENIEELSPTLNYFLKENPGFPYLPLTDQQAVVGNLDGMFKIIS